LDTCGFHVAGQTVTSEDKRHQPFMIDHLLELEAVDRRFEVAQFSRRAGMGFHSLDPKRITYNIYLNDLLGNRNHVEKNVEFIRPNNRLVNPNCCTFSSS
jgi:hypothetical protein